MGSREVEQRNNIERDLNILIDRYFLFSTAETIGLVDRIVDLMYETLERGR